MPPGRSVPSYGQAPAAGRSRLPSRARLPGSSIKVQYIPYTVQRTGTFTPYDGTVLATVSTGGILYRLRLRWPRGGGLALGTGAAPAPLTTEC